jgi:hypothetical protein
MYGMFFSCTYPEKERKWIYTKKNVSHAVVKMSR